MDTVIGTGKARASGVGMLLGGAAAVILGRIVSLKWPTVFDATTLDAFKVLVQGIITTAAVYVTPHDSLGGSP